MTQSHDQKASVPKSITTHTHMEELAYQRWEGERIAQEQFFYDPVQLVPLSRA